MGRNLQNSIWEQRVILVDVRTRKEEVLKSHFTYAFIFLQSIQILSEESAFDIYWLQIMYVDCLSLVVINICYWKWSPHGEVKRRICLGSLSVRFMFPERINWSQTMDSSLFNNYTDNHFDCDSGSWQC